MPISEEQWELMGLCKWCWSPIYKMDGRIKFTGSSGCRCELEENNNAN